MAQSPLCAVYDNLTMVLCLIGVDNLKMNAQMCLMKKARSTSRSLLWFTKLTNLVEKIDVFRFQRIQQNSPRFSTALCIGKSLKTCKTTSSVLVMSQKGLQMSTMSQSIKSGNAFLDLLL